LPKATYLTQAIQPLDRERLALAGGLAVPFDCLLTIGGNAEALLVRPTEIIKRVSIAALRCLAEEVDCLDIVLRQTAATFGIKHSDVHQGPG
jgi:hypothetical protein